MEHLLRQAVALHLQPCSPAAITSQQLEAVPLIRSVGFCSLGDVPTTTVSRAKSQLFMKNTTVFLLAVECHEKFLCGDA